MKLINIRCSPDSVTSSIVGLNALIITLFSKTLSISSSLNVKDQVSYKYEPSGKIIILYILIYEYIL
jgi:hypothetical protein